MSQEQNPENLNLHMDEVGFPGANHWIAAAFDSPSIEQRLKIDGYDDPENAKIKFLDELQNLIDSPKGKAVKYILDMLEFHRYDKKLNEGNVLFRDLAEWEKSSEHSVRRLIGDTRTSEFIGLLSVFEAGKQSSPGHLPSSD